MAGVNPVNPVEDLHLCVATCKVACFIVFLSKAYTFNHLVFLLLGCLRHQFTAGEVSPWPHILSWSGDNLKSGSNPASQGPSLPHYSPHFYGKPPCLSTHPAYHRASGHRCAALPLSYYPKHSAPELHSQGGGHRTPHHAQ